MTTIPSADDTGLSPRRRGNHRAPLGRLAPPRVYPRAGGGTLDLFGDCCGERGLSPRRRGNRRTVGRIGGPAGSIPAQAGEPSIAIVTVCSKRVYPRAGGGTAPRFSASKAGKGLSPRRRGNQSMYRSVLICSGSIPAQAGEPSPSWSGSTNPRVYPRAGGGTEPYPGPTNDEAGLSPRRRGNPWFSAVIGGDSGSIPAQAGEPHWRDSAPALHWVYPRAGGGTSYRQH